MTDSVTPRPLARSTVPIGGTAITVASGPILGGFLSNPATAEDQGITVAEVLFVSIVGSAGSAESATTVPIQPGQTFFFPANLQSDVSVNALTTGHRFSGVLWQPPPPAPTPQSGTFPPDGPTVLTALIPSYLYKEFDDDDDLRAFVRSYNALAQEYVDWFADVPLPVYTDPSISGALLDWVAEGLYGMKRPTLSSGISREVGPLNTYRYNTLPLNVRRLIGPSDVAVTTDDVFKRILTWNFYKGDGNMFGYRWLKRRIMRFLTVPNGQGGAIADTYNISVTAGPGVIAIRINAGSREIVGGALLNRFGFNRVPYNGIETVFTPGPSPFPLQSVLKEAIDSGVLQLPFQYVFSVTVSG